MDQESRLKQKFVFLPHLADNFNQFIVKKHEYDEGYVADDAMELYPFSL